MTKPLLAITMGDPAGVGPETIVGAWPDPRVQEGCRPFVVGNPQILRRAIDLLRPRLPAGPAEVREIASPAAADPQPGRIDCLRTGNDNVLAISPGAIDPRGGQAAYDALVAAARLALAGKIDGLVTAPLHKAALWRAGHHYPGHTELLAQLCDVREFAMMLYLAPGPPLLGPAGLGVAHVTLHMALRDAIDHLSTEIICRTVRLLHGMMSTLKGSPPRLAAAALNPHAGEEGLFGDEESRLIAPAVARLRDEGLDVAGPIAADTLMVRARDGEFDGVAAMVHDQGHIAVKLLGMHRAVNVTLGLPIVRTSVAHGTAFDLAWQGRAETSGMVEAITVAARLARENASPAPRT